MCSLCAHCVLTMCSLHVLVHAQPRRIRPGSGSSQDSDIARRRFTPPPVSFHDEWSEASSEAPPALVKMNNRTSMATRLKEKIHNRMVHQEFERLAKVRAEGSFNDAV